MQFPYYYTPVAGNYSPAERDEIFNSVKGLKFLAYSGSLPSDSTNFREEILPSATAWAVCVGLYAKNNSNVWYQLVDADFDTPVMMRNNELRFKLTSTAASAYGGNSFRAVVFYGV